MPVNVLKEEDRSKLSAILQRQRDKAVDLTNDTDVLPDQQADSKAQAPSRMRRLMGAGFDASKEQGEEAGGVPATAAARAATAAPAEASQALSPGNTPSLAASPVATASMRGATLHMPSSSTDASPPAFACLAAQMPATAAAAAAVTGTAPGAARRSTQAAQGHAAVCAAELRQCSTTQQDADGAAACRARQPRQPQRQNAPPAEAGPQEFHIGSDSEAGGFYPPTRRGRAAQESLRQRTTGVPRLQISSSCPPLAPDEAELVGEYRWQSVGPFGMREATLMLRENGQWWHAAHHVGSSQAGEPLSWQMAEALGSWAQVQIPSLSGGLCWPGICLTCDNARWSSDGRGSGVAPAAMGPNLRPDAKVAADVESAIDAGRLVLCFAVRRCGASGRTHLEMQVGSRESGPRSSTAAPRPEDELLPSVRMALFAQGFSRHYGKGTPVADDGGQGIPCSCGFGSPI